MESFRGVTCLLLILLSVAGCILSPLKYSCTRIGESSESWSSAQSTDTSAHLAVCCGPAHLTPLLCSVYNHTKKCCDRVLFLTINPMHFSNGSVRRPDARNGSVERQKTCRPRWSLEKFAGTQQTLFNSEENSDRFTSQQIGSEEVHPGETTKRSIPFLVFDDERDERSVGDHVTECHRQTTSDPNSGDASFELIPAHGNFCLAKLEQTLSYDYLISLEKSRRFDFMGLRRSTLNVSHDVSTHLFQYERDLIPVETLSLMAPLMYIIFRLMRKQTSQPNRWKKNLATIGHSTHMTFVAYAFLMCILCKGQDVDMTGWILKTSLSKHPVEKKMPGKKHKKQFETPHHDGMLTASHMKQRLAKVNHFSNAQDNMTSMKDQETTFGVAKICFQSYSIDSDGKCIDEKNPGWKDESKKLHLWLSTESDFSQTVKKMQNAFISVSWEIRVQRFSLMNSKSETELRWSSVYRQVLSLPPINVYARPPTEICVYILDFVSSSTHATQEEKMKHTGNRLASMRGVATPPGVSVVKVCDAGFFFKGEGRCVKCSNCGSEVDISRLRDPAHPQFHSPGGCASARSAETRSYLLELAVDSGSCSDIVTDAAPFCDPTPSTGFIRNSPVAEITTKKPGEVPSITKHGKEVVPSSGRLHGSASGSRSSGPTVSSTISGTSTTVSSFAALPTNRASNAVANSSSSRSSSTTTTTTPSSSGTDGTTATTTTTTNTVSGQENLIWFDEPHCESEELYGQSPQVERARRTRPGDFALAQTFDGNNLPTGARHPSVVLWIKAAAKLLVKLTVAECSSSRPDRDPVRHAGRPHSGSGFLALPEFLFDKGLRDIATYSSALVVVTNRHIVFNDDEAKKTKVEFFYDSETSPRTTVTGESVKHSTLPEDNTSLLLCHPCDEISAFVTEAKRKFMSWTSIPHNCITSALKNMAIVISHAAGTAKTVTWGQMTSMRQKMTVKRMALSGTGSPVTITRHLQIKMYTAHTFPGSTGGLVLTFCDGNPVLLVHNGVDRKTGLSCSVFYDDSIHSSENGQSRDYIDVPVIQSEDQAESRPYEDLNTPVHPDMKDVVKRVATYTLWPRDKKQRPLELAHHGLFYAGYLDCARCFHCGLGMRSWRDNDNILEEHKRFRPTCAHLQDMIRKQEEVLARSVVPHSDEDVRLVLAQQEYKYLKERTLCTVCRKSRANAIILPCGDLVACSDCAEELDFCPLCSKNVRATVVAYFA